MAAARPSTDGATAPPTRLPAWIRTRPPQGARYLDLKSTLESLRLGTVCREARCPNLPECWSAGTATIMLLGTDCSRRCAFCAVRTHWAAGVVDAGEPERVAEAIAHSGLRYVVLTQVCRDDLTDGGAEHMAETVRQIRAKAPGIRVELLIGDLGGSTAALSTVLREAPDVLAHNIETVREISPSLRDRRAGYETSLEVLRRAKSMGPNGLVTKSSIMLGVGETPAQVDATFHDLRDAGVDLVTLGQYLQPTLDHRPVDRYVEPSEFDRWKARALALGFAGAVAGPLVRSSYRADELFEQARFEREH